jgi:hypothetical protein
LNKVHGGLLLGVGGGGFRYSTSIPIPRKSLRFWRKGATGTFQKITKQMYNLGKIPLKIFKNKHIKNVGSLP